MHESEFGRKSYDRLKFDIKFGSRALRNFATPAKIFAGLRKFPTFSVFVFFSSFSCLIHLKTLPNTQISSFEVQNKNT